MSRASNTESTAAAPAGGSAPAPQPPRKPRPPRTWRQRRTAGMQGLGAVLLHLLLVVLAVLTLIPLVWLVAGSFKSEGDLFTYMFFPPFEDMVRQVIRPFLLQHEHFYFMIEPPRGPLTLENIHGLFDEIPFFRVAANSLFVAGATVILQLFFSSLGGFALARYEFHGKRTIMTLMLLTMMIPAQVLLAPLYELIQNMGLMDTLAGLIVPSIVSVFGMFLFRQSMLHIPDELLQAGRVDGCSEFRLYWNIALPVSRPMIGAFCLIAFMMNWNSFLWPQIILHSGHNFTLPIALTQQVGLYEQNYGVMLAGTLLSILPVVILFLILQREFIAGLTSGAVKG